MEFSDINHSFLVRLWRGDTSIYVQRWLINWNI